MLVLGLNCAFSRPDEDFVPGLIRAWHHDASACLIRDG